MDKKHLTIDVALVQRLIADQFPQWKDFLIRPVERSGWDNRTFRLGETMLVRMPSSADYASQVEKEHHWLPKLAPFLPLPIPEPLALGKPGHEYPWKWSIYSWLEGEAAASSQVKDLPGFAASLADFLLALQRIDSTGGPLPGPHSFYRGGSLMTYDPETRKAFDVLRGKLDVHTATKVWEAGLSTSWNGRLVWVHGDVSPGNLLVKNGKLSAVIDFGQLTVGDPACDLAITWTFFSDESRKCFRRRLGLDADTWARGRAWTLWKALLVAAGFTNPNNAESAQCWRIIEDVLEEHRNES